MSGQNLLMYWHFVEPVAPVVDSVVPAADLVAVAVSVFAVMKKI